MRFPLPCLGNGLFAGVGPIVGIVKVEKKLEAKLLSIFRERDCVFKIVRQLRWGVEQTQADPVVAMVFQYLQARPGNAAVFEDHALLFCLLKKGDVRADGVILTVDGLDKKTRRDYQETNETLSSEIHLR